MIGFICLILILVAVGFTFYCQLFEDDPSVMIIPMATIVLLTVVLIIQIFVIDRLDHKIKNIEVILNHKNGEQK
jgi:membrane protein YdbS with pleckstrin-like domain